YLNGLHKRDIPIYIISAIFRPSQIFFKPYGSMFREMLKFYRHLFVQDETSKYLLNGIGITNVSITGDTRFDRVTEICSHALEIPLVKEFKGDTFTLVVGSSWPRDEEIFIEYFNSHPNMKLIIAPHEIDNEHVNYIVSLLKRPTLLHSQSAGKNSADYDCLIIDCFGMLSALYRYGDVAYIGGGFGIGIHNLPEAAVYGIPIIFGPNYRKFREAHDLLAEGGAFTISDFKSFHDVMDSLFLADLRREVGNIAGEYIKKNTGATKRVVDMLPI
ncbi:MAG: glycosyltransferase N-terminal domain-containing protein, partial [Bacteroidales bacterium]